MPHGEERAREDDRREAQQAAAQHAQHGPAQLGACGGAVSRTWREAACRRCTWMSRGVSAEAEGLSSRPAKFSQANSCTHVVSRAWPFGTWTAWGP